MTKKYLAVVLTVFLIAAGFASAQTNVLGQLQDVLNRLRSQLLSATALGTVSTDPALLDIRQKLLKLQQDLYSYQAAPATVVSQPALGVLIPPEPIMPLPWPNPNVGCPGGATMPTGTNGQTIRCDGTWWVADSVILNDGNNVGIGNAPQPPGASRLVVFSPIQGIDSIGRLVGIEGASFGEGGRGVFGKTYGSSGIGVHGTAPDGKAVVAESDSGYGFYQSGANPKITSRAS